MLVSMVVLLFIFISLFHIILLGEIIPKIVYGILIQNWIIISLNCFEIDFEIIRYNHRETIAYNADKKIAMSSM